MSKTIYKKATSWSATTKAFAMALVLIVALPVSHTPAAAKAAPFSFADLVEKLSPAVVNISTVQTVRSRRGDRRNMPDLPEGMPFGDLWDQFRDRMEEENEPREARSLGSGFIIDADGYVVTNNHVVEEADEITVITVDGEEYDATIVGRDSRTDLALLKIESRNGPLPYVGWGNSEASRIGDWVIAIGNPFGLGGSVTAGILSARNREIGGSTYIDYIQTDAPINRGNSGGPMFNMDGEVIGVNTAIYSPTGGNVGIGFSIPSTDAQRIVAELKDTGRVRRGWLGVTIQPVTEDIAESLGLDIESGAIIGRVYPDSPAEAAGLESGDIILSWDGEAISDTRSLQRNVARTRVGKPVDVRILRGGEDEITIPVTTGELAEDEEEATAEEERRERRREFGTRERVEGMELAPLNAETRRRFRIGDEVEGVAVLRVSRSSAAGRAGIRTGTVIMKVNQQNVEDPEDVVELIDEAAEAGKRSVLMLVHYRGSTVHIPLRIQERDEDDSEDQDDDN